MSTEIVAPGKDLLTMYTEATEKQETALATASVCADIRRGVIRRLISDGMTQLEVANLLGTAQSTVWRALHGWW